LIAVSDPDQLDRVKEILESELAGVTIDWVADEQRARERISSRAYDLVVAHQHLPKDRRTPLAEEENRGLVLSQWIDAEAGRLPTVLLTLPSDTATMEAVNRLPRCDTVPTGLDNWENHLMKRVRPALAATAGKVPKRLDVDIHIDLEKNWAEADLRGVNIERRCEKIPLQIQGKEMVKLSMSVACEADRSGGEKWRKRLKKVGEALMRHIFERNPDFLHAFNTVTALVGGLENTRIRFIVEKKVHPVALEAIFGPHELLKKDYWMLHAPMYRTIRECPGYRSPLFHEDDEKTKGASVNFLIIESPTAGRIQIGGFEKHLSELKNVADECRFLQDFFCPGQTLGTVRIGEVRLIRKRKRNESMAKLVREALEPHKSSWHVVHYAGHSYFDPLSQEGYVFLPGPGNSIDKVNVELFSAWLRNADTRFVFLSSCHSSEAGFVFAMASQHIPAIVGFRWDIDDDMAFQYTKLFYQELFREKRSSLEYAFLKARKSIYEGYKQNPIWAAPVLVIQPI
jgi:hypothetical protein